MALRNKIKLSRKNNSEQSSGSNQRGLWSGAISFGLVNINVRVVSAKQKAELHFTMLDPSNLSPIGYRYYNKTTGDEVSRSRTIKAFEYKSGKYVVMTPADFKKANPKATQTIDIECFVQIAEIDPVFFEKAYYLLPNKGGEKPYALLCEALQKSKKVAIAKIILHTKQHLAAIIPREKFLLLELLHFAEDVKDLQDLEDWRAEVEYAKLASREVDMAEKLIADMTTNWNPSDHKDTYRADIMKLVKNKVRAGKATEISEDYEKRDESSPTQVLDLMPLLQKSLRRNKSLGAKLRRASA